jgi:hypothetical protein
MLLDTRKRNRRSIQL